MKAIQEKNKPLMALREVLVTLVVMMMITPLHAQVRIGQDAAPTQGAVLDLSSTSAGYIGGLKLPNVVITNLNAIPAGGATGFKEVPADLTTLAGTLVYNTTASTGIPVGIYFWDGAKWIKTKYEVKNGLSADAADPNIFKLGGALTEPTTISGLTATNKMAFTGTGVDAFNVDNTTLSVDATNHRVGIGTDAPTAPLHIQTAGTSAAPITGFRLQDGSEGLGKILYSRADGSAEWRNAHFYGIYSKNNIRMDIPSNGEFYVLLPMTDGITPGLYCLHIELTSPLSSGIKFAGGWGLVLGGAVNKATGYKHNTIHLSNQGANSLNNIFMYVRNEIPAGSCFIEFAAQILGPTFASTDNISFIVRIWKLLPLSVDPNREVPDYNYWE